jgi:CheY-like chemotaxis protein
MRPTYDILLVEDSPSDAALTREAMRPIEHADVRLHVVSDGVEALDFLHHRPPYTDAPRPDLILLDLNMPRKDGREVLADVKTDEALGSIPVIVLTSSSADGDRRDAYRLHANCYVVKPSDFTRFTEIIGAIVSFWFQVTSLPPR